MKINKEQASEIVFGDNEDWVKVSEQITGRGRWDITYKGVFRHTPTGRHYVTYWTIGATEYQDTELFYDEEVEFTEVKQVERSILVWETV